MSDYEINIYKIKQFLNGLAYQTYKMTSLYVAVLTHLLFGLVDKTNNY